MEPLALGGGRGGALPSDRKVRLSGAEQSPLGLRALDVQLTKQWLEPYAWGVGGPRRGHGGPPPRQKCTLHPLLTPAVTPWGQAWEGLTQ